MTQQSRGIANTTARTDSHATPNTATPAARDCTEFGVTGPTRRCGSTGKGRHDRDTDGHGLVIEEGTTKFRDSVESDQATIAQLVKAARARGDDLTGPNGLLKQLTTTVPETALDGEMDEHLGYAKHDSAGRGSGSSRNGTRTKTVLTDNAGKVEITVPRDRAGTFEPAIVAKHQRRLGDVDTIALSLYATGLTTGDISAHFEEIYGASIGKGPDQPDHRPGHRRDERVVLAAAAAGLRRGLHRRNPRQGP